jgi:hypothetical protein
MLFDPRWSRPAAPDLTLEALIAWLATRDPAEPYRYGDCRFCLLARFLRAQGFADAQVARRSVYPHGYRVTAPSFPLPPAVDAIARLGGTFGGALALARDEAAEITISQL